MVRLFSGRKDLTKEEQELHEAFELLSEQVQYCIFLVNEIAEYYRQQNQQPQPTSEELKGV